MELPSHDPISCAFWKILIRNAAVSLVAYYLGLKFVYPGYFHALAAHHSDMYGLAAASAVNIDWAVAWTYPRPVLMLEMSAAGDLGFEGMIIFFTALQLFNLAALLSILERFYLKCRIPVLVALLALLVAVCAPGFYISHTHDVGASLAMFFGILAIYTIESNGLKVSFRSCGVFGIFCLLSALSKESFLPVLEIYAISSILLRRPSWPVLCLLVLTPLLAASASLGHSAMIKSVFVNPTANPQDAYHISLAPGSIASALDYYMKAVALPGFIIAGVTGIVAAYLNGRLLLSFGLLILGASLYSPYLILPNHLMAYYWWSPFPFWMLLVPLGLVANKQFTSQTPMPARRKFGILAVGVVFWISCAISLWEFRAFNRANGSWFIIQQDINRNLMASLRAVKQELITARSTLVLGINYPFHPWIHPDFLASDLGYNGTWYLPQSANNPQKIISSRIVTADLKAEQLRQFDVILVFDNQGKLIAKYSRSNLARLPEISGAEDSEVPNLLSAPLVLIDVLQATDTTNSVRNYEVGQELYEHGCNALATKFLLRAINDPDYQNPYAYFFLGKIMAAKGELILAADYFSKAVEYDNAPIKNHFFQDELLNVQAAMRALPTPKS